ncbi:hypothetical protein J8273_5801 [Carpediemonas membranifera]|uniref:Uncharacterized protein n=1 Tax=Carpediemonas membranifera TaxID=201153 RepID=A0A8J6B0G5_9EUKA|nr:hypothetical protein J8273_5801 [Carpediemonas membranifera]|eukprot:KAG9392868.1 hypothetical protein J8273_5801 [Carpediemonas membranifera]
MASALKARIALDYKLADATENCRVATKNDIVAAWEGKADRKAASRQEQRARAQIEEGYKTAREEDIQRRREELRAVFEADSDRFAAQISALARR